MAKLSEKELAEWENKRDLNAELLQALRDMKRGVGRKGDRLLYWGRTARVSELHITQI